MQRDEMSAEIALYDVAAPEWGISPMYGAAYLRFSTKAISACIDLGCSKEVRDRIAELRVALDEIEAALPPVKETTDAA